jgi:amino acid adenylation domain-containing protein
VAYLLQELVRDAAAAAPENEAVRCAGRSLSYAQLDSASNGIAAELVGAGVRPGDRVGIHLPKCVEMVAAVYGILKAGAAYVPLDPHAPTARVATVANDCTIAALVTTTERAAALLPALVGIELRLVIRVDDPEAPTTQAAASSQSRPPTVTFSSATADPTVADPRIPALDTDLAYILYTSGSTGVPKGVMLSHRNAITFVEWCAETIGVGPNDRLSNHAPLHFDLSVFDLFLSALGRAAVVLVPDEQAFFGAALVRFIREERITTWYSVPSALMMITKALTGPGALPDLRNVVFAGEVFPTKHLRDLRKLLPDVELWNLYGPTETNVCLYFHVDEIPDDDRTIPIGRPCGKADVFALRTDGTAAGVGEEGELYVGGPLVMKGYWGRPDADAEVLSPAPDAARTDDRVYRTGDLVRLRPDGGYDFLGRRDHQIKSRGYRIELGDIETALNSHPSIVHGVALAVDHEEWGTAVVACVVPRDGVTLREKDVRRHVASRLPRYMVPTKVEVVAAFPRTSTGKVDRALMLQQLLTQPAHR